MRIGIIGASGYTGSELIRIIDTHPHASVSYVTAHTYAGQGVGELYPHLQGYRDMAFETFDAEEALEKADFFFVALPHGKAMEMVPPLLEGGARLVDLSADYRLSDPELYGEWYDVEHSSPGLLREAVYGLPEVFGQAIEEARLVSGPGCYPTAALLALAPLTAAAPEAIGEVIIDAKSGVSGAGRTLSLASHFAHADANVKPYGVAGHRHLPEIEEVLSELAGGMVRVIFTPHLVPMSRGILATCYVGLRKDISEERIASAYRDYYAECPFVAILPAGVFPETKAVCGSNYCHIGWYLQPDGGTLTVASAVDNLVKGASGQAVQCMNIMQGFDETEGLRALGVFP